jgi:hypothetical protein
LARYVSIVLEHCCVSLLLLHGYSCTKLIK